jgi:hypothetical protein
MSLFDNALHEFERGKKHLVDLDAHFIATFTKETIRWEFKANSYNMPDGRFVTDYLIRAASVPTISDDDRALLGDVVNCLRSSLDYLMWDLATKGRKHLLTEKQKRRIQFPMARNRNSFESKIVQLIPNITREQRAFFDRYQPYKRSKEGMAMRHLRNLSDSDKHRSYIEPAIWSRKYDFGFEYIGQDSDLVKPVDFHVGSGQEIKIGTKVATITLAGGQRPVHMSPAGQIAPIFKKSVINPVEDDNPIPIEASLNWIVKVIDQIFSQTRDMF